MNITKYNSNVPSICSALVMGASLIIETSRDKRYTFPAIIETSRDKRYTLPATDEIKIIALHTLGAVIPLIAGRMAENNSITVSSLVVSGACLYAASQIGVPLNYEDPQTREEVRKDAPTLTFDELLDKHGVFNLVKHQILDKEEILYKFIKACDSITFEEMLQYPIEQLLQYNLLPIKYFLMRFYIQAQDPKFIRDKWNSAPFLAFKKIFLLYSLQLFPEEKTLSDQFCNKLNEFHDQFQGIVYTLNKSIDSLITEYDQKIRASPQETSKFEKEKDQRIAEAFSFYKERFEFLKNRFLPSEFLILIR